VHDPLPNCGEIKTDTCYIAISYSPTYRPGLRRIYPAIIVGIKADTIIIIARTS
jgi:hypothetical protein